MRKLLVVFSLAFLFCLVDNADAGVLDQQVINPWGKSEVAQLQLSQVTDGYAVFADLDGGGNPNVVLVKADGLDSTPHGYYLGSVGRISKGHGQCLNFLWKDRYVRAYSVVDCEGRK